MGHSGNATNTFFVLQDSSNQERSRILREENWHQCLSVGWVDLVFACCSEKKGLDPRRDVQIVEVNFPNMARCDPVKSGSIAAFLSFRSSR